VRFYSIEDDMTVYPGEYILHIPSKQIVLCGAFKKADGLIKGMANGSMMEDKIENFQKIKITSEEYRDSRAGKCKGCGM